MYSWYNSMEVVIGLCRHDSSWDRYLVRVKYFALTEQTAWSPNRSKKMLRSDMSIPHLRPMATRNGPLRSPHPKTSLTPLVTPQGARPAQAWAYLISEVHPKNWPEFSTRTRWRRVKTLGQHQVGVNLQSHAQHQLWISTSHIFHEFHKIMPG